MKADTSPGKSAKTAESISTTPDIDRQRLDLLNQLWIIKRGLERAGSDRTIQMNLLRKDARYLQAVLEEAAASSQDDLWRAAARVRELLVQGIIIDPEMDLETAPTILSQVNFNAAKAPTAPRGMHLGWAMMPIVLALGVLIGALVMGWRPTLQDVLPARQAAVTPTLPAKVVLRIHGSNTLGAELLPAMAEAYLKREGASSVQRISTAANEWRIEGSINRSIEPVAIEIRAHGSGTAFKDIGGGAADIGASSRPIRKEEAQQLSRFGDMNSPAIEHVVGLDGIAVIVNRNNPVRMLSKAQIAQIFSGRIRDWADVGGPVGPIRVYARDEKSGTFDTFQHLVLGKTELAATATRIEDSAELSDRVATDSFGIGFIGLPYIRNAQAVAVADGDTLPLLPTPFTVATEDYPLARRLYLYAPPNPQNAYLRDFLEFAITDGGQSLVSAVGFISQQVTAARPPLSESLPGRYTQLIKDAERLSLSFRFRPESSGLDSKAQRDLERVVDFLARHSGRRVLLLGFTDNSDDPTQGVQMSRERAREVERELAARGIFATVVEGLGPVNPVASNDNPQSAARNRRVEIWVM
jgi:phosphate transport system substrate-binding protein